eukprot:gene33754-biopygen21870
MAIILGLESSCDETAAAIVRSDRTILSHALAGQEDHHRAFGGVVPEIAARAHAELMTPLVETALADAGMTLNDVDAIAATAGPGLIGGVMVGLVTASAILRSGWMVPTSLLECMTVTKAVVVDKDDRSFSSFTSPVSSTSITVSVILP